MGIKGASTCVMNFDGARGWLLGQANQGLACMFTMMNDARFQVGLQGLGIAERAFRAPSATPANACSRAPWSARRHRTRSPTRSSCTPTCGACC